MSNRKRLPSEKAKRDRCAKCRGTDLVRKGRASICWDCGAVTLDPKSPDDEEDS